MPLFNFNVLGWIDIAAGIMLYFTVSPLPAVVSTAHAAFLILKGSMGFFPQLGGMQGLIPLYIIGGAADIMSSAILLTGQPPVLAGYKMYIAGLLLLKGLWSLSGMMRL